MTLKHQTENSIVNKNVVVLSECFGSMLVFRLMHSSTGILFFNKLITNVKKKICFEEWTHEHMTYRLSPYMCEIKKCWLFLMRISVLYRSHLFSEYTMWFIPPDTWWIMWFIPPDTWWIDGTHTFSCIIQVFES